MSWRYRGQSTKLLVPYALLTEHLTQEKGVDLVGGGWVCSFGVDPQDHLEVKHIIYQGHNAM